MVAAHRQSIRLLQGIMIASAALPALLFAYASWHAYATVKVVAERQIVTSRDVLTEHALKVFEAVDLSIAETNEIIRGMTDHQIQQNAEALHSRLKSLADASTQIKSLWIFDHSGRALVNSLEYPAPYQDFSDRDYFQAHVAGEIGTYVGQTLRPRAPYGGAPFFGVSQRRTSSDGSFTGVLQASLLPEYFEGFYSKLGREPGNYYSLIREDGLLLARFPKLDRDVRLAAQSALLKAMRVKPDEGTVTLVSQIDGLERTVSYLKLPRLPVYVVAGRDASAVRAEWLSQVQSYLTFGLPSTAGLLIVLGLALRRTRRLYEEEGRRQLAEDALKQSQRLEALGQITGGVAHDFNNLLMVIGGSARTLKRSLHDAKVRRSLDMIDLAVQKGAGLTKKLLSFSRRRTLSPQVVDLNACIDAVRGVLAQSVTGDIALEFDLPRETVAVKIDPTELEIALLNLTLNARDAMPSGGKITIAVARVHSAEGSTPANLAGAFASISVTDTGTGIAADIRERIFEPFFTTKPVDKGTGLGLSQVFGFVNQSQGAVTVGSELGRGSRFTLFLPVSAERPETPSSHETQASSSLQLARVLLVEDNADVATIAADYLQQCGCSVVKAENAEAAIEILNRRDDIDLVFSDIAMPGMSGLELGRLVRDHHPEVPVVLATGYSEKATRAVEEGFLLLEKPYSLETMRQSLSVASVQSGRSVATTERTIS
jgi:two-component system, NtrC family, sensor kinase